MIMSKTHWKQLMNPDYLGAYALPEGQDITVTIKFVQREEVTGEGGKKEMCTVAHIENNKPMILNVTNQKTIAKMYGPYIEDCSGMYPGYIIDFLDFLHFITIQCWKLN